MVIRWRLEKRNLGRGDSDLDEGDAPANVFAAKRLEGLHG
jgi:hypothetical protein